MCFAGAALTGLVLYFLLENTALSITYASNVGIIVACAPFFVAVMVGIFFKEKQGVNFFIGFVIAITGVILISLSGEWEYPVIAVTRRIYFYGIILLMPILIGEHVVSSRGFVVQELVENIRKLTVNRKLFIKLALTY